MPLTYLLDNYIPFHTYLDYIDISKLYVISKKYTNCIPESYWYNCLLNDNSIKNIFESDNYISIIHNSTHKTIVERSTAKNIFRYIAICNSK
jgi:hypothetical protein